jgi:serralysin
VSLHVSDYQAVSAPSTVWGGAGNDTLLGGNAADTLWGNSGQDYLYGYGGDDFLAGGTAGVDGATVAEKDYFWGGDGFDKYSDGFDFRKWIHDGARASDNVNSV